MSNAITRLYEATAAAQELEEMIQASAESGGDITVFDGHFDILARQADSLPAAIDDVLSLVRDIEARAEARKAESDRMRQRAKRDQAVADWFRSHVLRVMQAEGMKKLETSRWRVTLAMPGGKQALEILGDVPEEFTELVVTHEIDKEAIRAALEGGNVLPFARLVEKQPTLRIS
jgi:hypothetical protein